ncbi:molybdopterin molybdotransferase MoeA [Streptomyces sp. CAU 1734]|uniref:molybdopterin molybdotransferase MoeA n=1 Tax=Streptomyces sp. CAU 1734 TaxID=3140360 RepID=UPI0032600655
MSGRNPGAPARESLPPDGAAPESDPDGLEEALALVRPRSVRQPAPPAGAFGPPGGSGPAPERPAPERSADRGAPADRPPAEAAERAAADEPVTEETETPERGETGWAAARELAALAGRRARGGVRRVPLERALGQVLAEPLTALCDLPSFDTSAMDGWAVAGPGPWTLRAADTILAGQDGLPALEDGTAVRIATGARTPPGATAVIRSEYARTDSGERLLQARRPVAQGQDIRLRGQECRSGDLLLATGAPVTPAVLGLAAAAGYDELAVVPRPRVRVLILGDELLTEGLPHDGLIRDALGPLTGPWLSALGAEVVSTRRLGDDARALHRAVTTSAAELILTTGGTASGPVDHVRPVLRKAGAELLIDGVAVRPGHPMLLARLPARADAGGTESPARFLVGLPGNPLAAVAGLLTLAQPLLRGLAGLPVSDPYRTEVRDEIRGHPHDTRLVPVAHRHGRLVPLHYDGPAMLRGIAAADGLAVVPPGGVRAGAELEVLALPWASPVPGGGL